MDKVKYQLKIKGLISPQGTISVNALNEILIALLECAERDLRLTIQGESVKKGKLPVWLSKSLDLIITGLQPGSTVLDIEAPVLGETAPDQIKQQGLWYRIPEPTDTAISLLSHSVQDTTSAKLESQYCDTGILDGLLKFRSFLTNHAKDIELSSVARPQENFHLSLSELEKIEEVKKKTPEPAVFLVSGRFETIQYSAHRFQLTLSNNLTLPGTIDTEKINIESMRQYWGKQVTVKGLVYFSPVGRARLIEAELIKQMDSGEEIFEKLPEPSYHRDLFETPSLGQSSKTPLQEIWGTWPGDETFEDLIIALAKD